MNNGTGHLIRAGIILVVGVIAFLAVREFMIPQSFGEYGHYRGDNVQDWASLPEAYSHTGRCNDCHPTIYGKWQTADHTTVSCETCHGPGTDHIEKGASMPIPNSGDVCLVCHEKLVSRPKDFPQVVSEEHSGGNSCLSCHNPHSPALGQPPAVPHTLEGRAGCLACHDSQKGLVPVPASHFDRTQDTCLSCHKAGITNTSTPRQTGERATPPATQTTGEGGTPTPTPVTTVTTSTTPGNTETAAPTTTPPSSDQATRPTTSPTGSQETAVPTTTLTSGGGTLPTPNPTSTSTSMTMTSSERPPAVPHSLQGRANCLLCHYTQKGIEPAPSDHAGRTEDMCLLCHQGGTG